MAKKKPNTHNLMKSEIKNLCHFIFENCNSHGIFLEEMLPAMASASGLTWKPPKPTTNKKRQGSLLSSNGFEVSNVVLLHRDKYVKLIEEEGLGGYVMGGDWYGFTGLCVMENLAKNIAGYSSPHKGRGRRYQDCLKALGKYTNETPTISD